MPGALDAELGTRTSSQAPCSNGSIVQGPEVSSQQPQPHKDDDLSATMPPSVSTHSLPSSWTSSEEVSSTKKCRHPLELQDAGDDNRAAVRECSLNDTALDKSPANVMVEHQSHGLSSTSALRMRSDGSRIDSAVWGPLPPSAGIGRDDDGRYQTGQSGFAVRAAFSSIVQVLHWVDAII